MRCNQVSIFIERFGEYVPKDYPGEVQRISVYVDDYESIYAALSKAYALAVDELAKHPKGRLRYEDDIDWQYFDSRLELCEDYIWAFEHSNEILEVIKASKNTADMVISLKERFQLSDYQVKKLLQFRFDMLTEQEYERNKDEVTMIKEKKNGIPNLPFDDENRKKYARMQIIKLNRQIEEIEAFLLAIFSI